MTIDRWLSQILKASPLPTLLGTQLYPVTAPQGITGFYCVYTVIDSPPILTQDNVDGTRVWDYQFMVIGPTLDGVSQRVADLKNFLTGYTDRFAGNFLTAGGIMRMIEVNTRDLPMSPDTRNFIRLIEINIMENLA